MRLGFGELRNREHPRAAFLCCVLGRAGNQVEHHGDFVARMPARTAHAIGPYLARQGFARDDGEAAALEESDFAREGDDAPEFEGAGVVDDVLHELGSEAAAVMVGMDGE